MKKQSKREIEIFRNCKYVIGRTKWDKEIVLNLAPDSKYFHCEEMLRKEFYGASIWKPIEKEKKIIFSTLGNTNYKGLDIIAKSGAELQRVLKNKIEFRIAGISENDEIFKIVQSKYGSDINNFVQPLGRLNPEYMIKEMLNADLFFHPSYIDNSPNSVCEAMMLGLPTVCTNVGGVSSLVKNDEDGILVDIRDIASISNSIFNVLSNVEFSLYLSKNARQRAEKRHDRKSIVNTVLSIYNDVLKFQ